MTVPGIVLARLAAVALALLVPPAFGAGKSVLLLQQDDQSWPAYQTFLSGFRATLARDFGSEVVIHVENLDLTRFPEPAYRDALRRWFLTKYQAAPIDVIVALGPAALRFTFTAREGLWQSVPVVFAGGTEETAELARADANASGSVLRVDTGKTLALAGALVPGAKTLVLVGDRDSRSGYHQGVERVFEEARRRFQVIDLRGLAMADLLARIAALPAGSFVHCSVFSRDGNGQRFVPREALVRIAAVSPVPVFGEFDSYFGDGIVGGQVVDTAAFGSHIARRVEAILRGEEKSAFGHDAPALSKSVVDWRQLKRWGIDESLVPAGVEVRFRAPSAWEEHRGLVLGALAAILLQMLLIGGLLRERRQRRLAEAEARARLTELARANRIAAAGEMGASIAHDLGQPLAAIQSNVESIELLLEAGPPGIAEARAALADVRRDNQRAADVIARLRALFRKSESRPERVDLAPLVRDVAHLAAGLANRKKIALETAVSPDLPAVWADAVQLQQVFVNLVNNAFDAIPDGAPRRQVVISARPHASGGVRLSVSDSGSGIAPGERARVLEPFYTTKSAGTGVGLAIVRRIVEAHGGTLTIGDSPLGGAEVAFTLPALEGA